MAGVLASRLRTALLLGTTPDRLAFDLLAALERPVPPAVVASAEAPCQEVVLQPPVRPAHPHPGDDEHAPRDAGPFLNMALLRAEDPETARRTSPSTACASSAPTR